MKGFTVTFTTFHDDYKSRGQPPSSMIGPLGFKTKDEAEQCLCEHLAEAIDDNVGHVDESEIKKFHHEEFFELYDGGEQWHVKDEFRTNLEVLKKLEKHWNVGEFIARSWSWTLTKFDL